MLATNAMTRRGEKFPTHYMTGTGGSKVYLFPALELIAVITSENFDRRDTHQISEGLLSEYVLGAVAR